MWRKSRKPFTASDLAAMLKRTAPQSEAGNDGVTFVVKDAAAKKAPMPAPIAMKSAGAAAKHAKSPPSLATSSQSTLLAWAMEPLSKQSPKEKAAGEARMLEAHKPLAKSKIPRKGMFAVSAC